MELAKAYVQIIPSADGIKGKISDALGGEASSAGTSAGSTIASSIKKAIAAAGIGQALKAVLGEGGALQQSLGGIETLFKDSNNKVIENAKNAYKTAGMSANEYMETVTSFSASLLQGLAGDTNAATDVADMALTDMSDNANKMGTDMELIQNAYQGFAKQNYTMLDNLKIGYGGTKTEMQRLLADATKLSGVKYDISNLSDVYSAIHVIQEDLGITGTTAKEAASTLSGSFASMKSAASNLIGGLALGEDLTPYLLALSDTMWTFVDKNLIPMLGDIASNIPTLIEYALSLAVQNVNKIANNADEIVQNGIAFVGQLATGIISALPYLAEAAIRIVASLGSAILNTDWMSVATDLMNGLKENLDIAAGEILGTDGDIIGSVFDMIDSNLPGFLEKGKEIVTSITNGILENIPLVLTSAGNIVTQIINFVGEKLPVLLDSGADILSGILDGIVSSLPNIANTIQTVFENIVTAIANNLPNILQSGANILLNLINGIVQNFPKIATTIGTMIINMLGVIGENLPKVLKSGMEIIGQLLVGIIRAVPKLISSIPQIVSDLRDAFMEKDWKEIGQNIIDGLVEGIKNAASAVWDAIKEVAGDALEAAKEALGIHSPSRKFRWIGEMCIEGFDNPLEEYNPYDTLKNSMRANVSALQGVFHGSDVYGNARELDYRKLGHEFANALGETGIEIRWNDRVAGRMFRKVAG